MRLPRTVADIISQHATWELSETASGRISRTRCGEMVLAETGAEAASD